MAQTPDTVFINEQTIYGEEYTDIKPSNILILEHNGKYFRFSIDEIILLLVNKLTNYTEFNIYSPYIYFTPNTPVNPWISLPFEKKHFTCI